jgi:aspartyl-tRNA(Asn)/glutamyl-tRNA(Gln) amidotransferase subunit C
MSASLSPESIAHLGRLARLSLTQEEQERYAVQLSSVVAFVEQLVDVATDHISPAEDASGKRTVLAADQLRSTQSLASVSREALIMGAPAHSEDGCIVVRSVMDPAAGGA